MSSLLFHVIWFLLSFHEIKLTRQTLSSKIKLYLTDQPEVLNTMKICCRNKLLFMSDIDWTAGMLHTKSSVNIWNNALDIVKLYMRKRKRKQTTVIQCLEGITYVYTLIRLSKYFTWTLKHIHLMPRTLTKVDKLPLLEVIFLSHRLSNLLRQDLQWFVSDIIMCNITLSCKVKRGHKFCLNVISSWMKVWSLMMSLTTNPVHFV